MGTRPCRPGSLEPPGLGPGRIGRLVCRVAEGVERLDNSRALRTRNAPHDRYHLSASSMRHLIDQALPARRTCERDLTTVVGGLSACDKSLRHKPIAHSCDRRGVDSERAGERPARLRTPTRQDHERPVLGERHIGVNPDQRTRGDRNEDTRCAEHRVHNGVRTRRSRSLHNATIIVTIRRRPVGRRVLRDFIRPNDMSGATGV